MEKTNPDRILDTYRQTAHRLNCTVQHLRNLLDTGRLGPEPISLGRKKLFIRGEIDRWVSEGAPPRNQWKLKRKR